MEGLGSDMVEGGGAKELQNDVVLNLRYEKWTKLPSIKAIETQFTTSIMGRKTKHEPYYDFVMFSFFNLLLVSMSYLQDPSTTRSLNYGS